MFTVTAHQQVAIDALCDGLKAGKTLLALRGLAGTGKTSVIPHLRAAIEAARHCAVAIGAPTHRAGMMLRQKGIKDAETFQSLAMQPIFDEPYQNARRMLGEKIGAFWRELQAFGDDDTMGNVVPTSLAYDDEGDSLIAEAKRTWLLPSAFPGEAALKQRAAQFGVPKALRSIGISARDHIVGYGPKPQPGTILIIDEGSMVGRDALELCQRAYTAVILVGDPGQLPPVNDVSMLASVEGVTLEEIHRQAAESSILRLAYAARRGAVQWQSSLASYAPDVLPADYLPVDRLHEVPTLVWRNATREMLTKAIRTARGYDELLLHPGEPLVCRSTSKEDRADGLYNNAMFRVVEVEPGNPRLLMIAPDGEPEQVQIVTAHLEEYDGPYVPPGAVPFRFGYCLTVHTAQGGQWPMVVIDMPDLLAHRNMCYARKQLDVAAQWEYTAATRAAERLILLRQRALR